MRDWFLSLLRRFCFLCKKIEAAESPVTAATAEITAAVTAPPPDNWRSTCSAAVGDKHVKATPPVPCQDAALACAEKGRRPCAFVADGAGSAELSHIGANEVVLRLSHLAAALEDIHAVWLDGQEEPTEQEVAFHAQRFTRLAAESIRHLTTEHNQPFKKFHCTLLGLIVGKQRHFWLHVGDGHLVMQQQGGRLTTFGMEEKTSYANITHFIREDALSTECQQGLIPAADVTGAALMTDGAAEKLVSTDGTKVAGAINQFLSGIRSGEFNSSELHKFLSDPAIWNPPGTTGDDKGIALLAKIQ